MFPQSCCTGTATGPQPQSNNKSEQCVPEGPVSRLHRNKFLRDSDPVQVKVLQEQIPQSLRSCPGHGSTGTNSSEAQILSRSWFHRNTFLRGSDPVQVMALHEQFHHTSCTEAVGLSWSGLSEDIPHTCSSYLFLILYCTVGEVPPGSSGSIAIIRLVRVFYPEPYSVRSVIFC